MSNVKPGDLAIIKYPTARSNNRIVEVFYRCPDGDYDLPDGKPAHHDPENGLAWVVKYVGGKGPTYARYHRMPDNEWTAVVDELLRPLPGETEDTMTDREVTA